MAVRPTALITGGTAGLGLSFAQALAAQGHDLVLVARDLDRLAVVAAEIGRRFGVEVETIGADLTDRAQLDRVAHRVADAARPVDVVVNNAGFGTNHFVVGGSLDNEIAQLDILTTAVLVLSHAAAGAMKARGRGAIVNVSSVSGFTVQASYSAAKAWCTTFSQVLAGELSDTGVTVTALCPGFVHTEFHQRAGMDMTRLPSWLWLDPDEVVAHCLRDVAAGRVVSIPGPQYKAMVVGLRLLPRSWQWWVLWRRPGARRSGSRR